MITLTFPWLFKSKANSYRIKRRRLVKDVTVAAQEAMASTIAASIMDGAKPLLEPIKVTIIVSMPDKRRRDIDGFLKSLLDSLNGIVWKDDSQIIELSIKKLVGQPTAFTSVTVDIAGTKI